MTMIKTFIQKIILLSTITVVLVGPEAFYKIIESCMEKNVNLDIDMDIENELEDDFEDEVKLKTYFQNDQKDVHLSLLKTTKNPFSFQESIIHNDLAEVFGPPPDFIN